MPAILVGEKDAATIGNQCLKEASEDQVRNIHELFQAKLPEKAHEYCVLAE
jgi:hypothetical protein